MADLLLKRSGVGGLGVGGMRVTLFLIALGTEVIVRAFSTVVAYSAHY
jgi:hypothetical protein